MRFSPLAKFYSVKKIKNFFQLYKAVFLRLAVTVIFLESVVWVCTVRWAKTVVKLAALLQEKGACVGCRRKKILSS